MTSTPEPAGTSGPRRLDAHLVGAGLARSRGVARELITGGAVRVEGRVVTRPAHQVTLDTAVEADTSSTWVGRGAGKLLAALERFDQLGVTGKRCLDLGASTGGFTQVLLEAGATDVVALDVGRGQLVPEIAADPRVTDLPGTNIRGVEPGALGDPFDLVVGDLSFISLRLVVPVLPPLLQPGASLVLLIKPQFEVGRERLGKNGIVRSRRQRVEAVRGVVEDAATHGLSVRDLIRSPVIGSRGNTEYLGWFTMGHDVGLGPADLDHLLAHLDEGEDE